MSRKERLQTQCYYQVRSSKNSQCQHFKAVCNVYNTSIWRGVWNPFIIHWCQCPLVWHHTECISWTTCSWLSMKTEYVGEKNVGGVISLSLSLPLSLSLCVSLSLSLSYILFFFIVRNKSLGKCSTTLCNKWRACMGGVGGGGCYKHIFFSPKHVERVGTVTYICVA